MYTIIHLGPDSSSLYDFSNCEWNNTAMADAQSRPTDLFPVSDFEFVVFLFAARQCSKRGGDIQMRVRDDGRVDLLGRATVVLQGEIAL